MKDNTLEAGTDFLDRRSIADARRNLSEIVHLAERGSTVMLTRRGEPVAMIVGRRDYERLRSKQRGFADAYRDFSRAVDLPGLAIDPDEVFADVREKTTGRPVRL